MSWLGIVNTRKLCSGASSSLPKLRIRMGHLSSRRNHRGLTAETLDDPEQLGNGPQLKGYLGLLLGFTGQ